MMDKNQWIKDLARAEDRMDEVGILDLSATSKEKFLAESTIQFLSHLKAFFIESAAVFNDSKGSPVGRLKIYAIAKTASDFMLFRNGYKMIFSFKSAGQISVKFNFLSPSTVANMDMGGSAAVELIEDQIIEAKVGPFGDTIWTYSGQEVKPESIVRYYFKLFIQESLR